LEDFSKLVHCQSGRKDPAARRTFVDRIRFISEFFNDPHRDIPQNIVVLAATRARHIAPFDEPLASLCVRSHSHFRLLGMLKVFALKF
jgi:hypothetical protein